MVSELLAISEAERMNLSFAETYRFQFVISESSDRILPGMVRNLVGPWCVSTGSGLPICILQDANNDVCGAILGLAVDPAGDIADGTMLSDLTLTNAGFLSKAASRIEDLAGRFLVLIHTARQTRVYLDPAATLSAVYNKDTRIVASTVPLAIDRPVEEHEPFTVDAVQRGQAVFALGYSPDRRTNVALSNHYINLANFTTKRHWPRKSALAKIDAMDREQKFDLVSKRIAQVSGALARNRSVILPISGGRDSRLLAAICKTEIESMKYAFVWHYNYMTKFDADLGKKVADELQMNVRVLGADSPGIQSPNRFSRRVIARKAYLASGFTGKARPESLEGITKLLAPDTVMLRGGILDMVRAVWYRSWPVRRKLTDDGLMHEIANVFLGHTTQYESAPLLLKRYEKWRAGLNDRQLSRIHDTIFIELFYPHSWQSAYSETNSFALCPAADRLVIAALESFPVRSRFHLEDYEAFLQRESPELAALPTHFQYRNALRANQQIPTPASTS